MLKKITPWDAVSLFRDSTPEQQEAICEEYDISWLMDKFEDKLHWENVSIFQELSIALIEKYIDKLDLDMVTTYQDLTLEFIEKYQDRLNWRNISIFQPITKEFILKYQERIDWDSIFCRGCFFSASELLNTIKHELLGEDLVKTLKEIIEEECND